MSGGYLNGNLLKIHLFRETTTEKGPIGKNWPEFNLAACDFGDSTKLGHFR